MTKDTSRVVAAVAVVIAAGALCGVFFQSKSDSLDKQSKVTKTPRKQQSSNSETTPIDQDRIAALKKRYPAITREEATAIARADAGKLDPMDNKPGAAGPAPNLTIDQIGRPRATADARYNAGRRDPMQPVEDADWNHKPAKQTLNSRKARNSDGPVVPPPPNASQVSMSEMPYPPSRPEASPTHFTKAPDFLKAPLHLRLSAIVGEKAIVLVPKELQIQNGWPRSFCLSKGDSIEDAKERRIQVASITDDSVILEENGERYCKSLAPIR